MDQVITSNLNFLMRYLYLTYLFVELNIFLLCESEKVDKQITENGSEIDRLEAEIYNWIQ